ncbi:MAG: DUF5678 domain-containing protein [Anaerolineales bacterium]
MKSEVDVFEQIQALIAPFSIEERLALIREIAAMPPPFSTETLFSSQQPTSTQLYREQAAWYALPAEEREGYQGEYVALHQGQVVDHDADQRALYIRIRERYGRAPVPILPADQEQPPTFVIHSPRLEPIR